MSLRRVGLVVALALVFASGCRHDLEPSAGDAARDAARDVGDSRPDGPRDGPRPDGPRDGPHDGPGDGQREASVDGLADAADASVPLGTWTVVTLAGIITGASALTLRAVHGAAPNDVWVAADDSGTPRVLHYDGTAWTEPSASLPPFSARELVVAESGASVQGKSVAGRRQTGVLLFGRGLERRSELA